MPDALKTKRLTILWLWMRGKCFVYGLVEYMPSVSINGVLLFEITTVNVAALRAQDCNTNKLYLHGYCIVLKLL